MHAPRLVRILKRVRESPRHTTLHFKDPFMRTCLPGQFVMVWVPGIDEVPMAVWGDGNPYMLTVEAKGDATTALANLPEGAKIGVRGPYGKPFAPRGRDLILVAGGTGTVPLVEVARQAKAKGAKVRVVLGGRNKDYLLLAQAFKATGAELHEATDDGSQGFHGRAPELLDKLIAERKPDEILTCGPERMMRAVAERAWSQGIPMQASLERWMKCAVGICDACLVDDLRLCRDGPVLTGQILKTLKDFGSHERTPDGVRVPIH
jgi:dihydroorotate dehydrogenase electron transfer subunit